MKNIETRIKNQFIKLEKSLISTTDSLKAKIVIL